MKTILLVFPHQLFKDHPGFKENPDKVVLIEDSLFFGDLQYPCNFHKQKLVFHRASMKNYADFCAEKFKTTYIDYQKDKIILEEIIKEFPDAKFITCEVNDFTLKKRIEKYIEQNNSSIKYLPNPAFLNSHEENKNYRSGKKRWFMADFYQHQRRHFNILMDGDKPQGGKWSFDEDNRKKVPKSEIQNLPATPNKNNDKYVEEALEYVNKNFEQNLGKTDHFIYPINHQQANDWLERFLQTKLNKFGPYEDAIVEDQNWLYHSILTPMLNVGLITPKEVIDTTLDYAKKNEVPIASLEGFIRQIIGWREFMRATYQDLGVQMRTTNHWQHTRKIPASFYEGTTGILPIDNTIKRLNETAYCHHIERLMVLGGFMFICEFDPDDIYKWFMEFFIDSYDWVMVPNVYAMSQNADGGLITTKPYFSGSAYIKKMSHYKTGPWCETWDGLYWNFIIKHADQLQKNPRWAMMVAMSKKMDDNKRETHLKNAQDFLNNL